MPRVVIVEDFPALQRLYALRLGSMPSVEVCGTARTEDEAVAAITAHRPDVVLLDLALAEGSGQGVLTRCRADGATSAFLVLTNLALPDYRAWCEANGVTDFFDKSTDVERAMDRVARWRSASPR